MTSDILKRYAIVADIGGTFARFSRVDLEDLVMDKIEIYACAEYESLESLLLAYKAQYQLEEVKHVALAIACPVFEDVISMTNAHWCFSISELKHRLGLTELKVLNDFNAVAMSLPSLIDQQILQVGRGSTDPNGTRVVLGAGTGLGVAFLASNQGEYIARAGEGGHMSWGASTEQEWFIYCYLKKKYDHVSYERLLSGHGLENLYQALAVFHQKETTYPPASKIISLALTRQCTIAKAAVAQFFAILGCYAGDLALMFASFGGVYIAGGIVPRLISLIDRSDFRTRFEEKGRFSDFNAKIPTYVITVEQPGILGAAIYLKQS
jgi:glucokinase